MEVVVVIVAGLIVVALLSYLMSPDVPKDSRKKSQRDMNVKEDGKVSASQRSASRVNKNNASRTSAHNNLETDYYDYDMEGAPGYYGND